VGRREEKKEKRRTSQMGMKGSASSDYFVSRASSLVCSLVSSAAARFCSLQRRDICLCNFLTSVKRDWSSIVFSSAALRVLLFFCRWLVKVDVVVVGGQGLLLLFDPSGIPELGGIESLSPESVSSRLFL